jgi:hypothetical protein
MAGGSLEERLRTGGALPAPEAVRVAIDLAAGLTCAHEAGVVHCDLKPANILSAADGSACVADFGIAHVSGETTSMCSSSARVRSQGAICASWGVCEPVGHSFHFVVGCSLVRSRPIPKMCRRMCPWPVSGYTDSGSDLCHNYNRIAYWWDVILNGAQRKEQSQSDGTVDGRKRGRMEHTIADRLKSVVAGDETIAGLDNWSREDVEESLEKLEKGRLGLSESLARINIAKERLQSGGDGRGQMADLEAHAERLREWQAALDQQVELLQRAKTDPDSIAAVPDDREHLRDVLANTSQEMAGVGNAIYLVNEWFFEREPGDRVDRRKEIKAVLENIREGSVRSGS